MRLAAVLLLFKEQAFVEACVRAIYPAVDSICCVTGYDRNFAGQPVEPDESLRVLLDLPDPANKLRLVVNRSLEGLPGRNAEARLRNAAMALDPHADYYLIVDSDEIWPGDVLRACWAEVQRTQWAGYRIHAHSYFRSWNYRVIEAGEGYRPFVFLRRGFLFDENRQIQWHGLARWKEYLRKGRKPKTVYFAPEQRLHHGSAVGDDNRMLTKLKNFGHADWIDPAWYDRVWKNFDPAMRDFFYVTDKGSTYERLQVVPRAELPVEISRCTWPDGWIQD